MEAKDDIIEKLKEIKQKLFAYDCGNAENLRKQLEDYENYWPDDLYEKFLIWDIRVTLYDYDSETIDNLLLWEVDLDYEYIMQ